jgi:hypothetical protein
MSEATTIRLWLAGETELARYYSKVPKEKSEAADRTWIPKSIIEGCQRRPAGPCEWPEHHVRLPDWFVERRGL